MTTLTAKAIKAPLDDSQIFGTVEGPEQL